MGKKRIVKKKGGGMSQSLKSRSLSRVPKKRMESGILHIKATYNNTTLMLTDKEGGAVIFSSSGALGFSGARKGTPFAAAKVGELVGEKRVVSQTLMEAAEKQGLDVTHLFIRRYWPFYKVVIRYYGLKKLFPRASVYTKYESEAGCLAQLDAARELFNKAPFPPIGIFCSKRDNYDPGVDLNIATLRPMGLNRITAPDRYESLQACEVDKARVIQFFKEKLESWIF